MNPTEQFLAALVAAQRAVPDPRCVPRAVAREAFSTLSGVAGWLSRQVGEHVDLTPLVKQVVDLDALISEVDLDAVAHRIDLVGLVQSVITEIDLPEIIRESTGSVASSTLRGVRMQGISADEAISRAVDRLRPRTRRAFSGPAVTVQP